MSPMTEVEQFLTSLTEVAENGSQVTLEVTHLDARTRALVAIGAAVCKDAPAELFESLVDTAMEAGATAEDVVGAFLAVAPAAGGPRVVAVAPKIAMALGYDIDAAFEFE